VLSFIQAKRWKNQLFNYHWARQVQLSQQIQAEGQTGSPAGADEPAFNLECHDASDAGSKNGKKRCQVLRFKPQKTN
jgi:hypothetical protein